MTRDRLLPRLAAAMMSTLALGCQAAPAELPRPDGPHAVGFRRFELADDQRVIPVSIWYPAAGPASTRAYFNPDEAATQPRSMARNFKYGETELDGLSSVIAHSGEDQPPADTQRRFPLVVFNHGYESYPSQNTALVERWASHGYVVVSVAHPPDAVDLRLADGRLIGTSTLPAGDPVAGPLRRTVRNGTTPAPERSAALRAYAAAPPTRLGRSQAAWRDDILFVVRAIERGQVPAAMKPVTAEADITRIAITGMSFGGSAAVSSCRLLGSCRAAINLDGGNQDPSLFNADPCRPLLLMQSDWTETPGASPDLSPNDFDYERWREAGSNPDVVRIRLDGIRHMGYTDLILLLDGPRQTERFGRIDGALAVEATGAATLAFLDQYLRQGARSTLVSVVARTPGLHWHDPARARRLSQGVPAAPSNCH